jgi:hypothetical protein
MSEARYLLELREAAPRAPERLRDVVRTLPKSEPRQALRLRPALAGAAAITVAIGLGAAVIGGVAGHNRSESAGSTREVRLLPSGAAKARQSAKPSFQDSSRAFAQQFGPKSRLQRQDVSMSLRVKDLSGATQHAVRTTRRLGGFVAAADYATDAKAGNSRLSLRVPAVNLQKAIASFTQLGAILAQHISVADLQGGVDRLDKRIATARRKGHEGTAERLLRRRATLIREGEYATVTLNLTTTKPAAKHVAPSRFDRFRDNAGDILGKELIAVLYALVIAGPFILLAALVVLGERARRRRADHRLLEETG